MKMGVQRVRIVAAGLLVKLLTLKNKIMELEFKPINSEGYFDQKKLLKVYHAKGCQFLGLTVDKTKTDKIKKSDYRKFLKACKEVIESDVFEGVFALFEMDLTPLDTKRRVHVNKDGTKAILTPADYEDKSVANKEDIQYRALLQFYFKSKVGKEELEERFGKIFHLEGSLPNRW